MSPSLTLLSLNPGDYQSSCGYCGPEPGKRSPSRSSHTFGIYPIYTGISCAIYMAMIDRGWRRSGVFLYKPAMKTTCCPQYVIRLDALQFSPSRSQRQVVNRWNRFVLHGDRSDDTMELDRTRANASKGKAKSPAFDLVSAVHSAEVPSFAGEISELAHRFEVTFEPSTFTDEKFQLYQVYQREIHNEEEKSVEGFRRFLVNSPLTKEPIAYSAPPPPHLPKHYGSYHQCYRLNGDLIAMAVLDILPRCVSSVYFMYNPRWKRFSFGKVSAVREAALAREIHDAGISSMRDLYMGFYVHSCPKMRYKADYAPSYLLDPEDYRWFPLKECMPILEKHRYACFSRPENSHDGVRESNGGDAQDADDVAPEQLAKVQVVKSFDPRNRIVELVSVTDLSQFQVPDTRALIMRGVTLLGIEIAQQVVFFLNDFDDSDDLDDD